MTILITGGTGTFGQALTRFLLDKVDIKNSKEFIIRIFSRDEFKQSEMAKGLNSPKLRYFIGDVRNEARLVEALSDVDIVIHAAAMKQIPACEYNPYEAVQTNIIGTQNVISACVKQNVKKAVFISSDKAVDPVNLYGATKLVAEKIWLNANRGKTKFSLTRWGNVMSSRGSVIPLFESQKVLTVTHPEMTRFWITPLEAAKFVWEKLQVMEGGEVFIPDLRSSYILDLAKAINPNAEIKYIGIRQGEKLHETLGSNYFSNDKKRLMSLEEVKKLYEENKSL